jgi:hypothetical protein
MMDEMMDAKKRYQKMMALVNKHPEKRVLVMQVFYAMQFAYLAYIAAYSANSNGVVYSNAIMGAGSFAYHYLVNEEYIQKTLLGGACLKDTTDKMQAVSDFMERFGIPASPRAITVNGINNNINKPVANVHEDMGKYLHAMRELRRSMEIEAAEKERRR